MKLPAKKTKIVCTIGPASSSHETLVGMNEAGMNVARLNFAHGDFESHRETIARIRAAARETGSPVAIMADLPGPKMRIGDMDPEPVMLERGQRFTLQTEPRVGDAGGASVSFPELPEAVKPGDTIFLNDGFIQLAVDQVEEGRVHCTVRMGGPLRSNKGVNLPGIDLGISAFTPFDRECLEFLMGEGVEAVSQSFVQRPEDVRAVREAARAMGRNPFVIAKIERHSALDCIGAILDAVDGIMVARGDLGVEMPIERVAVVQKELIYKANLRGKPVITATQMLVSMTENTRPTRAEVSDVTNAILDGADCLMLSEESAMGIDPVRVVETMASIARAAENHIIPAARVRESLEARKEEGEISNQDAISLAIEASVETLLPAAVVSPARSGGTSRRLSRFRLPVWILAAAIDPANIERLAFSYGVYPVLLESEPGNWETYARNLLAEFGIREGRAVVTHQLPGGGSRMEIINL